MSFSWCPHRSPSLPASGGGARGFSAAAQRGTGGRRAFASTGNPCSTRGLRPTHGACRCHHLALDRNGQIR
ncbi:hypothetical protein ACP4OV_016954 [Aristida adscensionis]